jgi:vacuolar protein sorting-associated protein 11
MLDSIPDETTELLIDICTTPGPLPGADVDEELPLKSSESVTNAVPDKSGSYLSYLALNLGTAAPASAPTASGTGNNTPTAPSTKTVKAAETSTPAEPVEEPSGSSTPAPAPAPAAPPSPPPANLPSPRLYFPHFVDHLWHFTVFLEIVARKRWGQSIDGPVPDFTPLPVADEQAEKNDQVAVWNTLLELYLTLPVPSSKDAVNSDHEDLSEEGFRSKAMRLLRNYVLPYDTTHALILCSSRSYTPGLVLLWEKIGMYEDVLRFWMDRALHPSMSTSTPYADFSPENASNEVVRHLHLYGPNHPHLYPLVLRFLTNNQTLLEKHMADVRDILQVIDRDGIISPLSVIQLLSRNSTTSVGLIKEWLMDRIKGAREEIDTVRGHFLLGREDEK